MKSFLTLFVLSTIFTILPCFSQSVEPELSKKLSDYIQAKKEILGDKAKIFALIERVPDGAPVYSQDQDELLHMASVQKLLISYVALKILGAEHKFITEVFFTSNNELSNSNKFSASPNLEFGNGNTIKQPSDLYIRPYGNPLMQYEDLFLIARELKNRGITQVDSLVLDNTLFLDPTNATGPSAYEAAQTASGLEFNSYRVDTFPSNIATEKTIVSVSPGFYGQILNKSKTLTLKGTNIEVNQSPDFISFANKSFPLAGAIRGTEIKLMIDGKMGIEDEAYSQYFAHPEPDFYFINAFKTALDQVGIKINGELQIGRVIKTAKLIYEHKSDPLGEVINRLNHFSNNFIAGQLMFAIGQNENGIFSKEKGMEVLLKTLRELPKFNKGEIIIDASGLSSENKISPSQILDVLKSSYADFGISSVLMSSLSRFGISGTLIDRNLLGSPDEYKIKTSYFLDQLQRSESVWAKTGTVKGVSSIAGYLEAESHQILGFCVVIKGEIEKKSAIEIENDIIKILLGIKLKSLDSE